MWPFRRKNKAQSEVTMTLSGDRFGNDDWATYQARLNGPNA